LTLLGPARERRFPSDVLLSRSRFLAPASHSLRFYREYFKPTGEVTIHKDRLRWRVIFHGMEFFINVDQVTQPDLGYFLEIKSRTWSRSDAENKAQAAIELISYLGVSTAETVTSDYVEIVQT
jgi:5-methylthioadenosine/S-adenosylhomocysteine deaminase